MRAGQGGRKSPISSRAGGGRGRRGELRIAVAAAVIERARIVALEVVLDAIERQVRPEAMVAQILHAQIPLRVVFLQDRVAGAVELGRQHAEAGAELEIEGGRRLDPFPGEVERGVAVVEKHLLAAHGALELAGGEMIDHVAETDRGGDADRARGGREQHRLRNAEGAALAQHGRGAERLGVEADRERVVANLVAYRIEQPHRLADRVGLGADHAGDEIAHEAVLTVEKGGRRKIGGARLGQAIRREDHSITSSARASNVGGAVNPSALAVLTLKAIRTWSGFSPLRMRLTCEAARRY